MTGRNMKRSPAAPPAHSASVYDILRTLMDNTVNPQTKKQPYARSYTRCVLLMRRPLRDFRPPNAWLSCGARTRTPSRHRPPARRQLQPVVRLPSSLLLLLTWTPADQDPAASRVPGPQRLRHPNRPRRGQSRC
jgi:hypothetical protein